MKQKIPMIVRILYGLLFLASGISFFFVTPPPMEGAMGDFFKGMAATGFFFYLLKGTEIICGLLLISGFFVPLALVVLAPIVLNIFLVHVFMAREGLVTALVIGAFQVYLSFFAAEYSPKIKQLFKMK